MGSITSCVIWSMLFNLSVTQIIHLEVENDYNNPHKCHRLLKGFSEVNEHMVPRTVPGTQ